MIGFFVYWMIYLITDSVILSLIISVFVGVCLDQNHAPSDPWGGLPNPYETKRKGESNG